MSNKKTFNESSKQPKHFDSIRPDGVCYAESIKTHQNFCKTLGNGTISPDYEEAFRNIAQPGEQGRAETKEQR